MSKDKIDVPFKIWDRIEKTGLAVITTAIIVDGEELQMTYSVGIGYTFKQPEMIIFGLPGDRAHFFINMYADMLRKKEEFKPDVVDDRFAEGYGAILQEVSEENFKKYLKVAASFNQDNNLPFKAFQLVYPDSESRWPWDDGVTDSFKFLAHVLKDKK